MLFVFQDQNKTDYELLGVESSHRESMDKQIIETGETFIFKETIKNNEIYTIETPIFDENRNIEGVFGMILENPKLSEGESSEKEMEGKWI